MTRNALIFDCDGVLADTELAGHLPAFNRAFADEGLDIEWSPDQYGSLLRVGGGKERLRAYAATHPQLSALPPQERDDLIARLHRAKTRHYVELVGAGALPARPGITRLIDQALGARWEVAVASTSARESVRAVLRSVTLPGQASQVHIFAGDEVSHKKPAPDIYQLCVSKLGLDPARCLVVEDSGIGAQAAAAAGLCHVVTVSHFTADEDFPQAASVLTHLGDPGNPARVLAGQAIVTAGGVVGLAELATLLGTPASTVRS